MKRPSTSLAREMEVETTWDIAKKVSTKEKSKHDASYLFTNTRISLLRKTDGRTQWLMPVMPVLCEAEAGRSLEARSLRLAWPTWQNPISTTNTNISCAWWHTPIIPATWEAEAGESLELGKQRLQWTEIVPLHSTPGNRERLYLEKKKYRSFLVSSFLKKET